MAAVSAWLCRLRYTSSDLLLVSLCDAWCGLNQRHAHDQLHHHAGGLQRLGVWRGVLILIFYLCQVGGSLHFAQIINGWNARILEINLWGWRWVMYIIYNHQDAYFVKKRTLFVVMVMKTCPVVEVLQQTWYVLKKSMSFPRNQRVQCNIFSSETNNSSFRGLVTSLHFHENFFQGDRKTTAVWFTECHDFSPVALVWNRVSFTDFLGCFR